jgi:putative hydrolase of the HAD superfamily
MKWTTLVFDLDDTLYIEREFVLSGFTAVDQWLQEKRGVTGFGAAATQLYTKGVRGRIFDEALSLLEISDVAGVVPQLVAIYRRHKPRLTLLPEARWAIERFRGQLKLGLITDGYAETQRNKVAALGIDGVFDFVVYTDDLGRENWKPSPVAFRQMMDRLGVIGQECIYVGDNPVKDFFAPNELGWMTVKISRVGGEYEKEGGETISPFYQAKKTINSLRELSEFIE